MATMFLCAHWLPAQPSASGCAVVSMADVAEAPALPLQSALSIRARPAPLGLTELSSLRVAFASALLQLGGWIDGRGSADWTDLTLGTHLRWTVDSVFALGIAPRVRSQWFRGFASRHSMLWDVQATAHYGTVTAGIALRDLPVATPVARPFIHAGAMINLDDLRIALDLGANADAQIWIGLSTEIRAGSMLRVTAALRTLPISITGAAWAEMDHQNAISLACIYRQGLGITPELGWIWQFDG